MEKQQQQQKEERRTKEQFLLLWLLSLKRERKRESKKKEIHATGEPVFKVRLISEEKKFIARIPSSSIKGPQSVSDYSATIWGIWHFA